MSPKSRNLIRCTWASNPLSIRYHDEEWGVPQHDDRTLFEFLILEGAQAGLSWDTILQKARELPRRLRPLRSRADRPLRPPQGNRRLLRNPGIVRNRLKIASAVRNAKAFLAVQKEFGSFDRYIWQFVGGKPRVNAWRPGQKLPARTRRIRRHEQRPEKARLQLRRLDHLLRLHAGGRHGERPLGKLLPLRRGRPGRTTACLINLYFQHSNRRRVNGTRRGRIYRPRNRTC